MLSRKQIALIHVAKNKLGMDEDTYRDFLWNVAGVTSSKELDRSGFESVMRAFRALGFDDRKFRVVSPAGKPRLVTAKQWRKVLAICYDLGWGEKELRGYCQRTCGVPPEFLGVWTCRKLINGLESYKRWAERKHIRRR